MPATGPLQLTKQITPDSNTSTESNPPFQQLHLQIQVHPFTGLPPALSGPIPQNIVGNIFSFTFRNPNYINNAGAGGAALQPPVVGVAMAQLRGQMNKLQGNRITFSGKENSNEFKNRMRLLINTKELTDADDILKEWLGHLTGLALAWATPFLDGVLETAPAYVQRFTLANFLTAFNRTYAFKNIQDNCQRQIHELKQGTKPVAMYIQQFQALTHQTGYGEAKLLQRFLMGLDKYLAHDLFLMRADQNIQDATNQVQKIDALRHGHANPYDDPGRSNRSQNNYNSGNNPQYVPMELDATKSGSSTTCYGCSKMGHFKRNCRSCTSVTRIRGLSGPAKPTKITT